VRVPSDFRLAEIRASVLVGGTMKSLAVIRVGSLTRILQPALILCLLVALAPWYALLSPSAVQAQTYHEDDLVNADTLWAAGSTLDVFRLSDVGCFGVTVASWFA
jgi:hypothetical protein